MWSRSAKVAGAEVISGYFRADGTRIYSVKPIEDYVFLREPTNPSCAYQIVGMIAGEKQLRRPVLALDSTGSTWSNLRRW